MTTSGAEIPRYYRFADLSLDVGRRELLRGPEALPVTRRTFALLQALVEGAPNVVTHDELARRVWGPQRIITPENLTQHVRMLRRALGDDASRPRYIEAVRGEGYRLVPVVHRTATAPAPYAVGTPAHAHAGAWRVGMALAAAAAVVAGAVVLLPGAPERPPDAPRPLPSVADELVRALVHSGEGASEPSGEPLLASSAGTDAREA
jgi:DNA-binding winged helix-turn-helix (wHTH) protein